MIKLSQNSTVFKELTGEDIAIAFLEHPEYYSDKKYLKAFKELPPLAKIGLLDLYNGKQPELEKDILTDDNQISFALQSRHIPITLELLNRVTPETIIRLLDGPLEITDRLKIIIHIRKYPEYVKMKMAKISPNICSLFLKKRILTPDSDIKGFAEILLRFPEYANLFDKLGITKRIETELGKKRPKYCDFLDFGLNTKLRDFKLYRSAIMIPWTILDETELWESMGVKDWEYFMILSENDINSRIFTMASDYGFFLSVGNEYFELLKTMTNYSNSKYKKNRIIRMRFLNS